MAFVPPLPVYTKPDYRAKSVRRPRVVRLPCNCTVTTTVRSEADYAGWSADFIELCRAQLDLLASSIPDVTQVALFFRQENARSGALEFVPLAVADNTRRVWIAHGSGSAEVEVPFSNFLPGGVPAAYLLPSYPAVEDDAMKLPDGGLCVPVEYNNAVAGSVVLWRHGTPRSWSIGDIARVRAVARSIAIAAALDGKMAARGRATDHAKELLNNARSTLGMATHQMRSAISALVTFGHVLLRRLEPGNPLRTLAKSIIVEARRLDDLLVPLDEVKTGLITEGSVRPVDDEDEMKLLRKDEGRSEGNIDVGGLNIEEEEDERDIRAMVRDFDASFNIVDDEDEDEDFNETEILESPEEHERKLKEQIAWERAMSDDDWMNPSNEAWVFPNDSDVIYSTTTTTGEKTKELLWLSDVAGPIAETVAVLAEEAGISFTAHIDNDAPAILASGDDIREAIYNVVHNGLRYTRSGGHVGLIVVGTNVVVWDTGAGVRDDEKSKIWRIGVRGTNVDDIDGDGIGLAVARNGVHYAGGTVAMRSPIPESIDPRPINERDTPGALFCFRFPRAQF